MTHHVVVTETAAENSTIDDSEAIPTRLLCLGMAHRDGSIHGPELYAVTEPCGLSVDQVRSCMRRLVGEGLFERRGERREVVFEATDAGHALLASTVARHLLAYAQDAAGRGWDRRWRLVAFAIPEAHRTARDHFRDQLLSLGAAPIHNGMYVSPHRWESEVTESATRLGIADHVVAATTDDLDVGGETDPRALAGSLWPIDEVAARYEDFIASYRHVPAWLEKMRQRNEKLSEAEYLPGVLTVAIRFSQCFDLDPLLPPELLPRPWPGREARDILAKCRRLGVLTRQDKSGPALFRVYDDMIANLP